MSVTSIGAAHQVYSEDHRNGRTDAGPVILKGEYSPIGEIFSKRTSVLCCLQHSNRPW